MTEPCRNRRTLRLIRGLVLSCTASLLPLLCIPRGAPAQQPAQSREQSSLPAVLSAEEAARIMPPSVFFKGLTAPIQARNAAGIRFSPDAVLLTALVDTSGYSSQVQAKYQAYLITETPLAIGDHRLPPGAYGIGFIANDTFIVMDIAGNDLFTAHSVHDVVLRRPTPLQILPERAVAGDFRLYVGRSFVLLAPDSARP